MKTFSLALLLVLSTDALFPVQPARAGNEAIALSADGTEAIF
jgi:hypothetical protein